MTSLLPIFRQESFSFESGVPEHIEAVPEIPTYPALFAVFGTIDGVRSYQLAVDIAELELAEYLADGRERHQEESLRFFGYTDDVYILNPDGTSYRTYYGRSI